MRTLGVGSVGIDGLQDVPPPSDTIPPSCRTECNWKPVMDLSELTREEKVIVKDMLLEERDSQHGEIGNAEELQMNINLQNQFLCKGTIHLFHDHYTQKLNTT